MLTRPLRTALLLGLGTGLAGVAATLLGPVLAIEESIGLQALFALRGPVPVTDDVVVIGMGRDSNEALDLPLGLTRVPRSLHAELLQKLAAAGASVVAFDILFEEPRDAIQDQQLAEAISDAGNVLLLDRMQRRVTPATLFGEDSGQGIIREERSRPLALFRQAAVASVPFPLPVVPVRTSQFWVFLPSAADAPTLPIAALQLHASNAIEPFLRLLSELRPELAERLPRPTGASIGPSAATLEEFMRGLRRVFLEDPSLGPQLLERIDAETGSAVNIETSKLLRALALVYSGPDSRYINYYGPPQSMRTVPYHRALRDLETAGRQWTGKAVFVGFSDRTQPDQRDSFYSVFSQQSGLNLSGVEIAATAFANLLESRPVVPLGIWQSLLAVLLWGLVLGGGLAMFSTGPAVAAMLTAAIAYLGFAIHQFTVAGTWWPLVVPLLLQLPIALFGVVWWNYAYARRRGAHFRLATSPYLPDALVRQLDDERGAGVGRYELAQGICLVTDAEQYTALSESMRPEKLAEFLNEYYEVLFRCVQERGGQVTDVVGDSMVSVWVVSDRGEDVHAQACRAALEIVTAQQPGHDGAHSTLPTRVGIHAGELLLGAIGARHHLEYRAVGDTVNSASRVQALNKQLGTRVLVTRLGLPVDGELVSRDLGSFVLAGKQEPLRIHELLGVKGAIPQASLDLLEPFAAAMAAYRLGDLERALEAFRKLSLRYPVDGPSRFYLSLCEQHRERLPAGPWDSVVRMQGK